MPSLTPTAADDEKIIIDSSSSSQEQYQDEEEEDYYSKQQQQQQQQQQQRQQVSDDSFEKHQHQPDKKKENSSCSKLSAKANNKACKSTSSASTSADNLSLQQQEQHVAVPRAAEAASSSSSSEKEEEEDQPRDEQGSAADIVNQQDEAITEDSTSPPTTNAAGTASSPMKEQEMMMTEDDQKPKAEQNLAWNVASTTGRGQGGRRSTRHQEGGRSRRSEAMAKKAAESLGINTASQTISESTTTAGNYQAKNKGEGGNLTEDTEKNLFEDNNKPKQESDDSNIPRSLTPSSPESSIVREPSSHFVSGEMAAPAFTHYPSTNNSDVVSTPMNTGGSSRDHPKDAFRQERDDGPSYFPPESTRPGAVSAMGRPFGSLPAWQRRRNNPESTTAAPLCMTADADHDIVTAEAVDEEAVVHAEDVQLDNRSRNKRMIIICSLIALVVVLISVVSVLVIMADDNNNDDDDPPLIDPRCLKDYRDINIVVHCKCFNTTEFYTPTLNEDERNFYNHFRNDLVTAGAFISKDVKMSSCLPQNQAILEIAAVNRNGVSTRTATEVINMIFFLDSHLLVDVYGIVLFYILMDGDNWEHQDNWLEHYDFCQYFGVECTVAGTIAGIVLPGNGLAGTLPTETSLMMRNLYILDLSQNKGIYGTLPAEIMRNLMKLHALNLDSIGLSGTIPEDIGNLQRLNRLMLRSNSFNGTLPSELGELELVALGLGENQFTGPLPTELGKQTNLQMLSLNRNKLTGTLPAELGNMTRLEFFDIRNNTFHGVLPPILGNLTRLDTTLITNSGLNGNIPNTFCNRDITDTLIEANCGEKNEGKMNDVNITSCTCCNRENRSLIWCWEDGLERLLEKAND